MSIGIEIESVIVGINMYKYFLTYKDINGNIIKEEEVSKEEFIKAEQQAGFYSKFGQREIATGGFSCGNISGSVRYIDDEKK